MALEEDEMSNKLNIQMTGYSDVLMIVLSGALDTDTADQFDESLMASIEQGWRKIAVDLSQIEFVSSAGIGVLVGSLNELQENDGDMYLVNVPEQVAHVLDMLALLELFSRYPDQASAINAYNN